MEICGKPHLTYKCWNNPDSNLASSAGIVSDGRMLIIAYSSETSNIPFK